MKNLKIISLLIILVTGLYACKKDEIVITDPPTIPAAQVALIVNPDLLTVINILRPDQSDKDNVLELLELGLSETMREQEGFISSNIHSSMDNEYIINYTQWESGEDLQAASELVGSGGAPNMAAAFGLGNPDFHPFTVVSQFLGENISSVHVDADNDILTIINILVPNDNTTQEELVEMLGNAMENELVDQPGFISSTIHQSMDSDYVINYAQWTDSDALGELVAQLQSGNKPLLGAAFGSATTDFHPYTIVGSYFSN